MSIALIQFKCIKHCILFYLNYFVFQLVLQKEPSVLIVKIFHRIHKKAVHFNKTYSIRKRQRVFHFYRKIADSEFHANWNIDPNISERTFTVIGFNYLVTFIENCIGSPKGIIISLVFDL